MLVHFYSVEGVLVKVAYIQAIGGASGDMLLASMIDVGLPLNELRGLVDTLGVSGIDFSVTKQDRLGISGTHLDVELSDVASSSHRWQDFVNIVQSSDLSDLIKESSSDIFTLIGQTEARIHGSDPDHVHLHELGTLDTLIDVVGVLSSLEVMGIEKVYCSALPTGSGTVRSRHGLLSVPAPATAQILASTGVPSYPPPTNLPSTGEMLTPTGAAILGSIAKFVSPVIQITEVGYGLGTRNPSSYPNVLSLTIGELVCEPDATRLVLLETNIDDITGEILGYVQEKLLDAGARDVWFTPIQMKKNRPATLLSTLADADSKDLMTKIILRETTTLGIRVREVERVLADRRIEKFQSSLGEVDVKVKILDGIPISVSPEYEDCKNISKLKSLPLIEVINLIKHESEVLI